MEGTSIPPRLTEAGRWGPEERHPPAGSKIIFERTGTQCQPLRWMSNVGWSAPQPPTPHPSGDRPWPFGRRGLLLCSPSMDWGKPKRSRNRRWSTRLKGLVRPSFGLPSAPDWRTSPCGRIRRPFFFGRDHKLVSLLPARPTLLDAGGRTQLPPITRSSRWTIAARPPNPRIERISAEGQPRILAASSAS
jgi:hypothetical protein